MENGTLVEKDMGKYVKREKKWSQLRFKDKWSSCDFQCSLGIGSCFGQ